MFLFYFLPFLLRAATATDEPPLIAVTVKGGAEPSWCFSPLGLIILQYACYPFEGYPLMSSFFSFHASLTFPDSSFFSYLYFLWNPWKIKSFVSFEFYHYYCYCY
uniref:T. congolense-specific, cell surface-expressed gene family n=1 Tax=Trypanosoma congolense (strain IL3000) TaxID=1068625 RepID=G0UR60_TRYCI|nr:hypothetical protein, unlikely [Trypanosoma congolense IL3000]